LIYSPKLTLTMGTSSKDSKYLTLRDLKDDMINELAT